LPSAPKRKIHEVTLDEEDVEWFNTSYPARSLSWVVNKLLKEFRSLHAVTPADLAKKAAGDVKRLIEEEA
jgi:activator of HSP90 ATPase